MGQVAKVNQPLIVWQQHFGIGIKANRIPLELITTENGIKETKLFQLKKKESPESLIAIISMQIQGLLDFLNVSRPMNANQILDTAELILQKYDDLSLTAIMDCFTLIKTGSHPFNGKLYESIDGRKILTYFDLYREHQTVFLENRHQEQKATSELSFKTFNNPDIQKTFADLKRKLIVNRMNNKNQKLPSKQDKLIDSWGDEFCKLRDLNQLPAGVVTHTDYYYHKLNKMEADGKNHG